MLHVATIKGIIFYMTLEKVKHSVVDSNHNQIILSKRVRAQITPGQFIEFIAIVWCQLKAQNILYIELLSQHRLTVLTLSFNLQPNFAIILPFHLLCHPYLLLFQLYYYLKFLEFPCVMSLKSIEFKIFIENSFAFVHFNMFPVVKIPLLWYCFRWVTFGKSKNSVDYHPEKCLGVLFFSLI